MTNGKSVHCFLADGKPVHCFPKSMDRIGKVCLVYPHESKKGMKIPL
ncbi:MAG TPA: hypothetical protein VGK06_12860 [Methanosarcina sp.]